MKQFLYHTALTLALIAAALFYADSMARIAESIWWL